MSDSKNLDLKNEYEYGFHDEDVSVYKTEKGLNEETVIDEAEPENGFAIIRDGEKIYLTDEELRAVRRRDTYNYLRKELNYWMTGLLDSHDEEYKEIDRFVRDKKNVDSLFAMLHAEFVECLYPEFASGA